MAPHTRFPTVPAIVVAFRRHTLLSLDDCLYALQPTIPHLTRSSLHRCLQRHGIGRLVDIEGDKPAKKRFKSYPIGFFHIDIAEVQTAEGKLYLFVAIDRTSKFAFVQLVEMSPNKLVVTMKSNCQGFITSCMAHASTIRSSIFDASLVFARNFMSSIEEYACKCLQNVRLMHNRDLLAFMSRSVLESKS